MSDWSAFQPRAKLFLEDYLTHNLPPATTRLTTAMRYAVLNGGKRFRGLLCLAVGDVLHTPWTTLAPIAGALECLHAYSLVHDDLPALDNDDWRRGKPACHKAFDEVTAILVGDALQALAFEWLLKTPISDTCKVILLSTFAKAVGHAGMVGGQSLEFETTCPVDTQDTIHHLKTGALIQASVQLPAIASHASQKHLEYFSDFGTTLGLAFQIQDDILDSEQDFDQVHLPKPYAAEKLAELKQLAISHLEPLPQKGGVLSELTQYFLNQVCAA